MLNTKMEPVNAFRNPYKQVLFGGKTNSDDRNAVTTAAQIANGTYYSFF